MNRIIVEVKTLSELKPFLQAGNRLYITDDILEARYRLCVHVGDMHTHIYDIPYEILIRNYPEELKFSTAIRDKNPFRILESLFLKRILKEEPKKDVFKDLDIIDEVIIEAEVIESGPVPRVSSGMPLTISSGVPQTVSSRVPATTSNEIPSKESKTVAILQAAYDVAPIEDTAMEAFSHMECTITPDELTNIMNSMRAKLPKFNMLDLSIDVNSVPEKKVHVFWKALNKNGYIYIREVSKLLAMTLEYKNKQISDNNTKQIE